MTGRKRGLTDGAPPAVDSGIPRLPPEGGNRLGPGEPKIQVHQIVTPKPERRRVTRDQAHIALGLRVAGMSMDKTAQALGPDVSPQQVQTALAKIPNLYEQVNLYRENLKLRKIKRLYDVDQILWDRIEEEIPKGSAKDVDALFRAAHAAEKIEANLAGEAQKVQVEAPQNPNVDLKILIQSLGLDGFKELGG